MAERRFSEDEPVMVSIRCITYNHAPYIRQCLEGFVMQKTNFRFQAVVHDDASTDGTTEIVREYAEKYPDIIVPMYEEENRWSKHDGTLLTCMLPYLKGKYIAECEGDDYWTDPLKLQKQVDFMESHEDYSICIHNAKTSYSDGNFSIYKVSNGNRSYTLRSAILRRLTAPTCSYLFRGDYSIPKVFSQHGANSDISLLYYKCTQGKAYFMADVMSTYNYGTPNSLSRKYSKQLLYKKKIGFYKALKSISDNNVCLINIYIAAYYVKYCFSKVIKRDE